MTAAPADFASTSAALSQAGADGGPVMVGVDNTGAANFAGVDQAAGLTSVAADPPTIQVGSTSPSNMDTASSPDLRGTSTPGAEFADNDGGAAFTDIDSGPELRSGP